MGALGDCRGAKGSLGCVCEERGKRGRARRETTIIVCVYVCVCVVFDRERKRLRWRDEEID